MWREDNHVNNFLCELYCVLLLKIVWNKFEIDRGWQVCLGVCRLSLQAMPQDSQRDADDTLCTSPRVWKKGVIRKDDRKIALDVRVMNDWLLNLHLYSWYTCTFSVLKNQCFIMFYFSLITCFPHIKELSLHQLVSRYIVYTLTMCCFVFRS